MMRPSAAMRRRWRASHFLCCWRSVSERVFAARRIMRLLIGTRKMRVRRITAVQMAQAAMSRARPACWRWTTVSAIRKAKLTAYQIGIALPRRVAKRRMVVAWARSSSCHRMGLMKTETANSVPTRVPMQRMVTISRSDMICS